MGLSCYRFEGPDLLNHFCAYLILRDIHVVPSLKIQPETWTLAEVTA